MKIYKKYFICCLIFLMMIISTSSCLYQMTNRSDTKKVSDVYTDISESDWFAEPVQQACDLGLMNGTSETEFEPQAGMNRAMFTQALYTLKGKPQNKRSRKLPFNDVDPKDSYYDAVNWMYTNNMHSSQEDTLFEPLSTVTREQAAYLFYAFAGKPAVGSRELSGYPDGKVVDSWAREACVWAVQQGLIPVTSENGRSYLEPRKEISRAEAADLLVSFFIYNIENETPEKAVIPEEFPIRKSSIPDGVNLPVLMYHEVADQVQGQLEYLFVKPDSMRSQLQWLKNNGYETIHFSDLTRLSEYQKPIILTFDDGYEGNYTNLYPLLKEFNMKATIFVVTDDIGKKDRLTEKQLREMSDSGLVSIQSHTKSHQRMDTLSDPQLIKECRESKLEIRRITGVTPHVISYPEGRYNSRAIAAASSCYDIGVIDRYGRWKTSPRTFYYVTRTVIPRSFTLQQFADAVSS